MRKYGRVVNDNLLCRGFYYTDMPKGVYVRTPEMIEKIKKNLEKATKALNHGISCNCAMCRGKRGEYSGKNNPRYKHGRDVGWYKFHKEAREKKHLLPQKCERCGEMLVWDNRGRVGTGCWEAHHIDGDSNNDSLTNCKILCWPCHEETL